MNVEKFFFKTKKKYTKMIKNGNFPVDFFVLYDNKTKLILFEPFAAIDDYSAGLMAREKFKNSRLGFDLQCIDLVRLFTLDYVSMSVDLHNELVCNMCEVSE